MGDPNIQVKDSAAWTLGRVCEHVPEAVLNKEYLLPLLTALVKGLEGEPRVATNVCWVSSLWFNLKGSCMYMYVCVYKD